MHQTLPFISAARRLRGGRERRSQPPKAPRAVAPIDAARAQTLANLEREVHAVREAIFNLADSAQHYASHDYTQLHVSLQIVSNELGQIELMLDQAREAARGTASAAS
jgi:hypothetical protein